MVQCSAPWFELNCSAPDNNVSACCYYAGDKETWSNEPADIKSYWNGPGLRKLRRLQTGKRVLGGNGCANCFYFENFKHVSAHNYMDFPRAPPPDLSERQRLNWELAMREFSEGTEVVSCTPIRVYANFGFACNLACKMCHQVPRRGQNRSHITADAVWAWRDALLSAQDVFVIGGEPFALPEAIKFIRRFVDDEELDSVILSIGTNGSVHHKHFEYLRRKRKVRISVSLDSIGDGYETIRVGGKWKLLERNLLMAREAMATDRPDWMVATNAIIMKTGVPYLPEYARWHVEHDIPTAFYDFINYRGTEDAFETENIIRNPHLLDDVPGWEEYFAETHAILLKGHQTAAAESLQDFLRRVMAVRESSQSQVEDWRRQKARNDWQPTIVAEGGADFAAKFILARGDRSGTRASALDLSSERPRFTHTRTGDHLFTNWLQVVPSASGAYTLRLSYPKPADGERLAYVAVQGSDFAELPGLREQRSSGFGMEVTVTGTLARPLTLRLMIGPVGEGVSLLPHQLSLDLDRDSGCQPAKPLSAVERLSQRIHRKLKRSLRDVKFAIGGSRDDGPSMTG